MPSRALNLSWVAVVAVCLFGAVAPAAVAKPCKAKQITLARTKGTHWCLSRPPLPATRADATIQVARWLGAGKLSPPRLQRLVPRLPARLERAFGQARDGRLRVAAQAAGDSQSQGPIAPGPGQAGTGYASEGSKSSTEEDAEHATVVNTHTSKLRREAFGPKCPDSDGNVVTKISMVLEDVRSTTRRGKRTIVATTAKVTGTLAGGFTDEFDYRGPLKLDLDFVIETRASTEIAATGKTISREGTSTRRIRMTASVPGDSLGGSLETPIQSLQGMTVTGAAGPHGVLTNADLEGDVPLLGSLVGLTWTAKLMGEAGFAATVANAAAFGCVVAAADPASFTLANGETASFTVVARGLDDQRALPTSSNTRVYSGSLTLSPLGTKLHGPAGGMPFSVTSGGGASVAEVVAATRRGYAPTLRIPISERKGLPKRFDGTWTTTYTGLFPGSAWKETITGRATYVRDPLFPPVADDLIAVPYEIASGSVTWTVSGTDSTAGCTNTYSGTGTVPLPDDTGTRLTLQVVSGTYYYSIRASSDPVDPPIFTITRTGGAGCSGSQEGIVVDYLEIGDPHDLGPETTPELVATSAAATLLAGHAFQTGTGYPPRESSWSFSGFY